MRQPRRGSTSLLGWLSSRDDPHGFKHRMLHDTLRRYCRIAQRCLLPSNFLKQLIHQIMRRHLRPPDNFYQRNFSLFRCLRVCRCCLLPLRAAKGFSCQFVHWCIFFSFSGYLLAKCRHKTTQISDQTASRKPIGARTRTWVFHIVFWSGCF